MGASPLDAYLPAAQQILGSLTPGTFSADYGVSSSQMPTFLDPSGKLNSAAAEWVAYHLMSGPDRQNLQDIMVTADLMKSTDVNGVLGTASNDAFRGLVATAASQNVSADYMLSQINQGGLGAVQQQIQSQATAAQAALNKQTPVSATVENPTTIAAALTAAAEQTLGLAPTADQINKFVAAIQGQDVSYAEAGNEANKAQAQSDLTRAQSAESALNKLGPDGIDSFLSAYQSAISGGGVAGAGTTQGPQTGTNAPNIMKPGTPLPPGTNVGFNPSGTEMFSNTLPTQHTTTEQVPPGGLAQLGHAASSALGLLNPVSGWSNSAASSDIQGLTGAGTPYTNKQVTTSTPTPGMAVAPSAPPGLSGATALHGGIYALTPALWQQAVKMTPSAKSYSTAGAAPLSIQQAAVTNLAHGLYMQYGSWSDVAIAMAGGTPGKTTSGQTATGTKTNIQSFAEGIATSVSDQISQLQSQVNAPGPAITEKVTAPDVASEANLAEKNSDPIGYAAANYSSLASEMTRFLFGSPVTNVQSSSDTFTGPVNPGAAAAATPAPATGL
jgi:hypothetical protein